MKAIKIILASVCLALFSISPAMAQGFGWKGKTIEDMELTFDEKVVKRDSPENLVKSFFDVLMGLRTRTSVFNKMQRLQIESEAVWLKPLITEAAYKQKIGAQLKELEFFEKNSPKYKIEVHKTEKSGSESIVHFTTHFSSSNPCIRCNPNGQMNEVKKDCKSCKGTGVKTREDDSKGRATVHTVDGKLFMKSLETACYSCKGEGVCIRCKNNGGTKPCYSCKGTKACRECSGNGFTPDRTLIQGPKNMTDLPKKEKIEATPDLSNPRSTFSLFSDALVQSKRIQSTLQNRCVKGYRKFLRCYVGDTLKKTQERKFRAMSYTLVKKVEIDENTLKFHYSAMSEAEAVRNKDKDELANARYVLILVKVKDQWKINSFLRKCWGCNGKGVDYQKKSCEQCKGEKYTPATRLR